MMNRAFPFLTALLASAAALAGQEAVSAPPAPGAAPAAASPAAGAAPREASAIILAPPARDNAPFFHEDSDGITRSVSPTVAAALADGMPKWSPPTPTPTPVAVANTPDLRDLDRPKNEIKRLPKYVVVESRPPVFRDKDLYTHDGLAKLGMDSHPGLMFGNFLGLNDAAAYQMYLDDQRLTEMSDLADTARAMARGGDAAEGSYILQQSRETYMRPDDDFHLIGPSGIGGNTGGGGK